MASEQCPAAECIYEVHEGPCATSYPRCPEDGLPMNLTGCHHPNPHPRMWIKNRHELPVADTTAGQPIRIQDDLAPVRTIHDHSVAWIPDPKRGTVPVLCSAYIAVLEAELRERGADSLTFDLLKTAASRLP
jgi:hypothetical protein